MKCSNGKIQSQNDPCGDTCPVAKSTSTIALSIDSCPDEKQCFDGKDEYSKFNHVCSKTIPENLSGQEYAKRYCDETYGKICADDNLVYKSNSNFKQCYGNRITG